MAVDVGVVLELPLWVTAVALMVPVASAVPVTATVAPALSSFALPDAVTLNLVVPLVVTLTTLPSAVVT